jgi:hypothetical protein
VGPHVDQGLGSGTVEFHHPPLDQCGLFEAAANLVDYGFFFQFIM